MMIPMRELSPPAEADTDPIRPRPTRTRRQRVALALVAAAAVLVAGVIVDALAAPGSDPAAAKLAEWARDHGLGAVVSSAER